mgnify:CR=1 FL=1
MLKNDETRCIGWFQHPLCKKCERQKQISIDWKKTEFAVSMMGPPKFEKTCQMFIGEDNGRD